MRLLIAFTLALLLLLLPISAISSTIPSATANNTSCQVFADVERDLTKNPDIRVKSIYLSGSDLIKKIVRAMVQVQGDEPPDEFVNTLAEYEIVIFEKKDYNNLLVVIVKDGCMDRAIEYPADLYEKAVQKVRNGT